MPGKPDPERECRCGRPAVYVRPYEGRHYCDRCFCQSIEKKVLRTIREGEMIRPGDRIGVALSGGKDSVTVLSLVNRVVKPMNIPLVAITIDEGIAGYRPESLKKAETICRKLGVRHMIYSYKKEFGRSLDDQLRLHGTASSCTFCGTARRSLLNKAARDLSLTKLCTGHNADDEAQSALMNMLRGDLVRASRENTTAPAGEKFVVRIKPLKAVPEREIALYALLKGFDVSFDECPYATGLRFEVRDFLNSLETRHPGMKFSLLESVEKLRPALKQFNQTPLRDCSICGEPTSGDVCKTCELWNTKKEK